jgi:DMSO/TMAO reductase YedYZ molybdopterin-dependent catalytic subunit
MSDTTTLRIDGEVENAIDISYEELAAFAADVQVPDVSRFQANRKGDGVTLESLLKRVRPQESATYLTLHATLDDFAASIPLEAVRGEGILVYRVDGEPMTENKGGPFRFLIRNPAACHTDELDDCANVKFLDRIELTAGRGRDTRPETDAEHAAIHEHDN